MREYIVLRDLQSAATNEPFGGAGARSRARGGPRASAADAPPPEPRVELERLDKGDVRDLARDPEVTAIAPPMPTRLIDPVKLKGKAAKAGTAAAGDAWGIAAVGANVSGFTGAGVVVSVLDTGIDASHPAFAGVNLTQMDFSGSGDGDKQGHGSHCAGTVFGRDVGGARIGVARGVSKALIGKVLGDEGGGSSDMLFRGIQWAIQGGANVISMSLGFDFPGMVKSLVGDGWPADLATSRALEAYRANLRMFDALMELVKAQEAFGPGAVVVAAAGNESERQQDPDYEIAVSLPAAAEGVVSVGAVGQDGATLNIAPFSNTFPQISAPGVAIKSVKVGGGTRDLNGTSMACPHVAGVAALWWEAVRSTPVPATARTVLAKLLASARTDVFSNGVDVADRGVGLAKAP
ncbi:MAG: S8 family peptidase [Acidimicrobiales bacterium]